MRMLFVMEDFHGWEPGAAWDDFRFGTSHSAQVERVAMVGEKKWQRWLTKIGSIFLHERVRYFDLHDLAEAERWVRAANGSYAAMAQIFSRSANVHSKVIIVSVVVLVFGAGWTTYAVFWSPYVTYVSIPLEQPVPFSHKHHVGDDGIDCRYCHTSVEKSSFAGIPSTHICMTCHSQIWTEAPILAPVRESFRTGQPFRWNRVNDLPDFVFFNHSIHVNKGVGCSTCHGESDQMPLTWRTRRFT